MGDEQEAEKGTEVMGCGVTEGTGRIKKGVCVRTWIDLKRDKCST